MFKNLMIGLITLFILSACNSNEQVEPRAIKPEVDACEVCQMSIVHTEYATQVIDKNGGTHIYDDIGCMIEEMKESEAKESTAFVKTLNNNEWVKLEEAVYVYDESFWTPMANGVMAFSTKEAAEKFLAEEGKGTVISLEKVMNFDWGH